MSGPASRLLSDRIDELVRRLEDVEKLEGRVAALEGRVGVAPRLPAQVSFPISGNSPPPLAPGFHAAQRPKHLDVPEMGPGARRDVLRTSHPE